MTGIDKAISGAAAGHGGLVVVLVAFALGLRHASDPDHLVAVSTLVASTRDGAARAAAKLGAAWGAGHATTMLAFGTPVIWLRAFLPEPVQASAEAAIGVIIAVLALRVLVRWRRGAFHSHVHHHAGTRHLHVHSHVQTPQHGHAHALRTPAQAYSIGLVHGLAGSAGVAVLIVAAVPSRPLAAAALLVMVVGTTVSMTFMSGLVGRLFSFAGARRAFTASIPALGAAALVFGVWYAAAALFSL